MNVGVNVNANLQGAAQSVRSFTRTLQELRDAARGVNGDLSKLPGDLAAEVRAADAVLQRVIRSPTGRKLGRSLSDSGQTGPFHEWDESRLGVNPGAGNSRIINAARVGGIPVGDSAEDEEESPGEESPSSPRRPKSSGSSGFGGALAMAGRFALPLLGIGGALSIAHQGLESARSKSIEEDTLMRSLSSTATSFNDIDAKVRQFGEGLGLAYQESARLMQIFARTSNAADAASAAQGGRVGAGFARSFGLDEGRTVGAFGNLSMSGAGDPRQMAALIAETIAKSGRFAQADDVVDALERFSETARGNSLTAPPTEEYARMYAGLSAQTGLRGGQVEGLLGQMDSSFRQGGSAGEASKVFLYRALGESNPFKAKYDMEGGLFAKGDDGMTNYDKVMSSFTNGTSGMGKYEQYDMLSNLFGINMHKAQALMGLRLSNAGGLSGELSGAGVDLNSVAVDSFKDLAQIQNGSPQDLENIRTRLLGNDKITGSLRDDIQNAQGGDLKNALYRGAATAGREITDGDKTREAQSNLQNAITNVGDLLLKPLNAIQANTASFFGSLAAPDIKGRSDVSETDFDGGPLSGRGTVGFGSPGAAHEEITRKAIAQGMADAVVLMSSQNQTFKIPTFGIPTPAGQNTGGYSGQRNYVERY